MVLLFGLLKSVNNSTTKYYRKTAPKHDTCAMEWLTLIALDLVFSRNNCQKFTSLLASHPGYELLQNLPSELAE